MSDAPSSKNQPETDPGDVVKEPLLEPPAISTRRLRHFVSIISTTLSRTMLVAIGFAVGAFILIYDYLPNDPYLKTTPFQLYALVVLCQTVFGAVALGSMAQAFWSLKDYVRRSNLIELVLWSALFGVLIYYSRYFSASCPAYGFRNHGSKTELLTFTVGPVAIIAGIGSILVNIGLRELLANRTQPSVPAKKNRNNSSEDERRERLEKDKLDAGLVRKYLQLRGNLLHFLSVVGILLGLVGITQSAKRYMILESTLTPDTARECFVKVANVDEWLPQTIKCLTDGYYCETPFDRKKVFVYGLYYTVILVLTFLPTFSNLVATGHKIRDDILPIPSPHSNAWNSYCAKRAKLDSLLSLSMTEGLRALIAVLAPVLGTLISLLGLLKG